MVDVRYDNRRLARRSRPEKADKSSFALYFDTSVAALLLFTLVYLYVIAESASHLTSQLSTLLLINGLLALVGAIISLRRQYTSFFMTFFFIYLFFAVAPLQQVQVAWRSVLFDEDLTGRAALLCLAFTLIGLLTLFLRARRAPRLPMTSWRRGILNTASSELRRINLVPLAVLLAPLAFGLLAVYAPRLFTSREEFSGYVSGLIPKEIYVIVVSFIHPFIFIGSASGLTLALMKKNTFFIVVFAVLMMAALLIYNPAITPRFRLSAMLMFFVLVFIGWRSTRVVLVALLVGLFLSPLMNELRFVNAQMDVRTLGNFFVHMDYDAFAMLCYTIQYVDQYGADKGLEALSAFLFFVPRAIWAGKSEHSAAIMFPFLNSQFGTIIDNLSSPPVAEGYFAFRSLGAIGASGLYFRFIYWVETRAVGAEPFSAAQLLACLLPMFLFILLRGPLIVGVAEISGATGAMVVVIWLFTKFAPRSHTPGLRQVR